METFLYLFIHYGLPLLLLIYFIFKKIDNKLGLIITAIFSISILLLLYLWGQWPIVGSYYFRYLVLILKLAFLLIFYIKNKSISKSIKHSGIFGKIRSVLTCLVSLIIIFACVKVIFFNSNYNYETIELSFPLQNGEFYVSSGGTNNLMNNHVGEYENSQQYAIDVNKLNNLKSVSKQILSKKNESHFIYSDTVYCPCNGIIQEIKNNVDDNVISSINVSSKDGF